MHRDRSTDLRDPRDGRLTGAESGSTAFPRLVAYTGSSLLFLAACANLKQAVLGRPDSQTNLLPLFVFLNAASWALGSLLEAQPSGALTGRPMLALGDALLPLNLLALLSLFGTSDVRSFGGWRLAFVLLAAALHQLLGLLRVRVWRSPRVDIFYPYFFAVSGGLLGYLGGTAISLSTETLLWLFAGFGIALATAWARLRPELDVPFSFAGAALLALASAAAAAVAWQGSSAQLLLLQFVVSCALLLLASRRRDLEIVSRSFALAGFGSLTLALVESLHLCAVPASSSDLALSGWTLILTLLGILLAGGRAASYVEGAHWLASLSGIGVSIHVLSLARSGTESPSLVPPFSLLLLVLAFGAQSVWRRRHPAIAATLFGFVANLGLLELTSYLAPLLLIPAMSGLCRGFGAGFPGSLLALASLGAALFLLADLSTRIYPPTPLRVAGYAATIAPVFLAFPAPGFTMLVLLVCAAIFLWRSAREESLWPHVCFLVAVSAAAVLLTTRLPFTEALSNLAWLAVALIAARGVFADTPTGWTRASTILALAIAIGAAALLLDLARAAPSPVPPFVFWLGLSALLLTSRSAPPRSGTSTFLGRWLETALFVLLNVAGVLAVVAWTAERGLPLGASGPALALWALPHFLLSRALTERDPAGTHVKTSRQCARGIVLVSILLPIFFPSAPYVAVVSLLASALLVFHFECDSAPPKKGRPGRWIGHALAFGAAALSLTGGVSLALAGLTTAALLLLWRSLQDRSLFSHLGFLGLTTAAAAVLAGRPGPAGDASFAFFALALLGVQAGLGWSEGRTTRVRLTMCWALGAGASAVALGLSRGTSWFMFLPIWLGFLAVARAWEEPPGEAPDRPCDPEDEWIAFASACTGHIAGVAALVLAVVQTHGSLGTVAASVALWAWFHLAASLRVTRRTPALAPARSIRWALHAFACASLIFAGLGQSDGLAAALSATAIGSLYLVLRRQESNELFGRMAALAFIEASWLLGLFFKIRIPEYYLFPPGIYLCAVLASRSRIWSARRLWPAALLSLVVVLSLAAYPFLAFLRTGMKTHFFFLGAGALSLLWLVSRVPTLPGRLYVASTVCASFAAASLVAAFGEPDRWITLFLVTTGAITLWAFGWAGFAHRNERKAQVPVAKGSARLPAT